MVKKISENKIYGGIEGGGTKFRCVIGSDPDNIYASSEIDTKTPVLTIKELINFFSEKQSEMPQALKIGIGCFGPLDLDPQSKTYGYIKETPKLDWKNIDIRGELERALKIPVIIDTDVNAAAIGELIWGAGRELQNFLYATIGTGIGVGAVINKRIFYAKHHPEMGHMFIPLDPGERETYTGCCPYHGSCVEGLASGSAITKRWGSQLSTLQKDHPAWQLEAEYLATFFANLTFAFQPQKIIVGGGVMNDYLLSLTREILSQKIADYSNVNSYNYLVRPQLGNKSGVMGAVALARNL